MSVRPGQAKGAYTGLNAADLPIPVQMDQTITMTATGFDGTAPTTNVSFVRCGKMVVMGIHPFSGTSNSTGMTLFGPIPSWALPATDSLIFPSIRGVDNGSGVELLARLVLPNMIVFNVAVVGNFTASGTKGAGGTFPTWFLPQFSTYIVP